jgi:tetratricopeptide (TPR) repeat protein
VRAKVTLSCVVLLAMVSPARAQTLDPDTEAAVRHYHLASEKYQAGRYAEALAELEQARALRPLPALDYDIARAHDRLEHWAAAKAEYERYLRADPRAADAEDIRARIETLRARIRAAAPEPIALVVAPVADDVAAPASRAPRRVSPVRAAAASMLGVALASAGTGAGLLGSVARDWNALASSCAQRACAPADWADAQRRADAGYAFVGIAAAAAVVDLTLWIVDRKQRR